MELTYLTFSVLITFLLSILMLLKMGKRSKTNERNFRLPPGPRKLPFIGNLHQLVGSLPHHRLRELSKKYGPFMHLQLGQVSTIIVSSPDVATEIMKIHDVNFASRPELLAIKILSYDSTNIAFSPYGVYWKQLRKICTSELLSMKRVQSFRSMRQEEVSQLINWVGSRAGTAINLTDKVYSLIYGITSRAAFGKKCKDQELFKSTVKGAVKLVAGFNVADLFPSIELLQYISGLRSQLQSMLKITDRIIENIINEHKERQEALKYCRSEEVEDLVDVFLKVQEHGDLEFPLTTDNIKAVILDIYSAGSETSAATIDWAMSEMMKNTRVLEKAQAEVREVFNRKGKVDETGIDEMKFLRLVIKETLRLHPPVPLLLPRECKDNCVINGFDIPMKTRVIVNAWAIGRDPKYWIEPESFIPERFLDSSVDYKGNHFEYIPFGAGRRICPGMSFGLASVELPLAMLLYHFDWKLPNGMTPEDLDMTEDFGAGVRRKEDLHVIPISYACSPISP